MYYLSWRLACELAVQSTAVVREGGPGRARRAVSGAPGRVGRAGPRRVGAGFIMTLLVVAVRRSISLVGGLLVNSFMSRLPCITLDPKQAYPKAKRPTQPGGA